ncbi:MAG: putative bifunctional diguanylate cyclase/phosphodiesterase [Alphaproteobacteria bacterium]
MAPSFDTDDHYLERELYAKIRSDPALFDFLQNGCLDGLWYWDLENPDQEWLSPRFKAVFGYGADEMANSPDWWKANIHPDDLERVLDNFERHKNDPSHPYDQVVRYRHKSGRMIWIRCRGLIIRDETGRPIRMLGAHTDVTDFKQTELRLLASEQQHQEQLEMLHAAEELGLVGHWHFNPRTETLYWSKQVFRIHGLDPDGSEPSVEDAINFYHPEDRDRVSAAVARAVETSEPYDIEARIIRPDGSIRDVISRGMCARAGDGSADHMFGIFLDVTDRKAAERRTAYLAYHDALTGLSNRTGFQDALKSIADGGDWTGDTLALLVIDLDRFKEINDTFGHPAGDDFLEAIARRIASAVKEADMVARLGGDEFAVILKDPHTPEDAEAVADRIIKSVEAPLALSSCGSAPLWPGCSIGVRFARKAEGLSSIQFMADADIALYEAKSAGRRQACLYRPALRQDLERTRIEGQTLKRALEAGELLLHWQPFVSSRTGGYEGAEALLRWQHPELGLIGPDRFALSLQDDGLMREIDLWVLRTALQQTQRCDTKTITRGLLAVNIAGERLANNRTRDALVETIGGSKAGARRLILEISEDVVLSRQADQIFDALGRLRSMGVRIALDDFGTGKATLAHLKDLPVDFIKIARSFVEQVHTRDHNKVIVQAIIGLAHGLGARTIGEGVERHEEADLLRQMGCDSLQGYLIGRPMALEALGACARKLAA